MKKAIKSLTAFILAFLLFITPCYGAEETNVKENAALSDTENLVDVESVGEGAFSEYLNSHKDSAYPTAEIPLLAKDALDADEIVSHLKEDDVILIAPSDASKDDGDDISWEFNVVNSGLYAVKVHYSPVTGGKKNINFSVKINGEFPFSESQDLVLNRIWENKNGEIEKDAKDNEIRPNQTELSAWAETVISDYGNSDTVYYFYLERGKNTLSLGDVSLSFYLKSITLFNSEALPSYDEYKTNHTQEGQPESYYKLYEGERAERKSDPLLYPTYDRSDPLTSPSHPSLMRLNVIGGANWDATGQWIEWDIEVPEDGLYKIGMRARQNVQRGMNVTRKIYVDGEVLFSELNDYVFSYSSNWKNVELGNKAGAFLIALDKGKHTLRMEVRQGGISDVITALDKALVDLNTLYRKIIMITGASPDTMRDYALHKQIPDLKPSLNRISGQLLDQITAIEAQTGNKGSDAAFLRRFAQQLQSFSKEPDTIPERLSNFKTNISSFSTLSLNLRKQPLEIDYIYVATEDYSAKKAAAGFFQRLIFEIKMLIASFVSDYSLVGGGLEVEKSIDVWITLGRDQAQVVSNIINDMFTPRTGIGVNLNIIAGSVIEPIMAGRGPDVVLGVGRNVVTDMAARDVILPLNEMAGYDDIFSRFQNTAAIPYMYNGHTYAVPETQEFSMMFIRRDIYHELSLEYPKTWDDIKNQVGVIQQNNLNIGLINGVHSSATVALNTGLPSIFNSMLLQNGMSFFNGDLNKTVFNDPKSISIYQDFISFYKDHSCLIYFDAINQFRTGEMPLIISPLSIYNSLFVFAPEIRGLWDMVPIPGTETGTGVDISTDGMGSGSIILADNKDSESSWKFLDFWSTAEVQSRYAQELETLLGAGARHMTANTEAFYDLAWSREELEVVKIQREAVVEMPQLPGQYMLTRNLTNAFIATLEGANVRDAIIKYGKVMDEELIRRQKEFNYKTGEGYYAKGS